MHFGILASLTKNIPTVILGGEVRYEKRGGRKERFEEKHAVDSN